MCVLAYWRCPEQKFFKRWCWFRPYPGDSPQTERHQLQDPKHSIFYKSFKYYKIFQNIHITGHICFNFGTFENQRPVNLSNSLNGKVGEKFQAVPVPSLDSTATMRALFKFEKTYLCPADIWSIKYSKSQLICVQYTPTGTMKYQCT